MIIDFREQGTDEIYVDGIMIHTKDISAGMLEIRLPNGEYRRMKFGTREEAEKALKRLTGGK